MINISFWRQVKEKWIKDEDPTIKATDGLIQHDGRGKKNIDQLFKSLNSFNSALEQVESMGASDFDFGDLNSDDEE